MYFCTKHAALTVISCLEFCLLLLPASATSFQGEHEVRSSRHHYGPHPRRGAVANCGPAYANAHCTDNKCCSSAGWCGTTVDYCGTGCRKDFGRCNPDPPIQVYNCGPSHDNAVCGGNDCCSPSGWCGTSEDYCRSPDCLRAFGRCDASQVPKGTNTSSIPRPKFGKVPYGKDIYDCIGGNGKVALTFDDGPYEYTMGILDVLEKHNAKATFFITGINNGKGAIDEKWVTVIKRMYANGHQIASHTWSHADLSKLSSIDRKDEMWKNEMALRNILGFIPVYMRPPYSSCSASSGCARDMADLGYHITYFNLDTDDYERDTPQLIQGSKDIFEKAILGHAATKSFLVIAHDIHQQTATNLTDFMLATLNAQGYRPVTVGDCMGDPKENWYRSSTTGRPFTAAIE